MPTPRKRATVYFDPDLHRTLRLKAAETERSISDLVNDSVRLALAEDAADLEAFEERAEEPNLPFEGVVKDLERVTRKGQVTIPAEIRRSLKIEEGSIVEFSNAGDHMVLRPLETSVEAAFGIVRGRGSVSLETMEHAIRHKGGS